MTHDEALAEIERLKTQLRIAQHEADSGHRWYAIKEAVERATADINADQPTDNWAEERLQGLKALLGA